MWSPKLKVRVFNRAICSFHFFGILGFITGVLLGIYLCDLFDLRTGIILLMSLTGVVVFFLLAIGAKIITGEETIVYYHHEIAILIACSVVLQSLHLPVLPYLDIVILGIASFLAFGRIGCFSVGCCHGRPAKKGVIYGHQHVQSGFTFYYEGISLLPVQLIESAFVFIIILVGSFLLLPNYAPGTVLIVYTVVYGAFRFAIEFFRGDPERPYWKGLSEAQWTTLLLIAVSLVFSTAGFIPLYTWHLIISVLLFISAVIIVLRENLNAKMNRPAHIRQIAMAINESNNNEQAKENQKTSTMLVDIYQTDLGLSLSNGQLIQQGVLVRHYTISCKNGDLTYTIAERLAKIIRQIQQHKNLYQISETDNQVFHILFKE